MHTDANPDHFGRYNAVHLLILLIIALALGIYVLCTTVLMAKDGVTFISYAQNLTTSFKNVLESNEQHPGYPALIAAAHEIVKRIAQIAPPMDWVYSAQSITLVCRLLAIVAIYFIGKLTVGIRHSFWAVLILIALPKPAGYGSDTLSDWPHLLFLMTGFLVLMIGTRDNCWWCFGLTGLLAGMGYLIRPECAPLIVYGGVWLTLCLGRPISSVKRTAILFSMTAMIIGFAMIAAPYMYFKGGIFPKKHVGEFSSQSQPHCEAVAYTAAVAVPQIVKALGKLFNNIGDTLMWFFMPFLFIGLYTWYKKRVPIQEKFLLLTLLIVNIVTMIWLYSNYGYMSHRHTLPLVVFTIFYIPLGIEAAATWVSNRLTFFTVKKVCWTLLVCGIVICIPKLVQPQNADKQSYKIAAEWLAANTDVSDSIAVPDIRISFYARRNSLRYEGGEVIPLNAHYVVRIFKPHKKNITTENILSQEHLVFTTPQKNDVPTVAVYRRIE
jgi:hypothetical protein